MDLNQLAGWYFTYFTDYPDPESFEAYVEELYTDDCIQYTDADFDGVETEITL